MAAKTYTVGTDTALAVERLREHLERLWQVQPTYAQVIRHAVFVANAKLHAEEEGRND